MIEKKQVKHVLSSRKDTKPTINYSDVVKHIGENIHDMSLQYTIGEIVITIPYKLSRNGKTFYAKKQFIKGMQMPQIGFPVTHTVNIII